MENGEQCQKIDIVEFIPKGPNKGIGQPVAFELFPTGHDVNYEEAVDLSNYLLGMAQINCVPRAPERYVLLRQSI